MASNNGSGTKQTNTSNALVWVIKFILLLVVLGNVAFYLIKRNASPVPAEAAQVSTSASSVTPSVSEEVPATIVYEDPVTEEPSLQVSVREHCSNTELSRDGCVLPLSYQVWSEKICSSGSNANSTRFFVNTGVGFVHMKLYRTTSANESGVLTTDDSNDGEDRRTFRKAGIPYPRCIQFFAGTSREVTVQTRSSWSF